MGLTLSCRRQSPWICGVFCLVWLRPRFVLLRCFLCRRNANLAGRFACRRCCRVSWFAGGFSMVCPDCEAKGFHNFRTLLYRFSHSQDRALERDRPQQRKKNGVGPVQYSPPRNIPCIDLAQRPYNNLVSFPVEKRYASAQSMLNSDELSMDSPKPTKQNQELLMLLA